MNLFKDIGKLNPFKKKEETASGGEIVNESSEAKGEAVLVTSDERLARRKSRVFAAIIGVIGVLILGSLGKDIFNSYFHKKETAALSNKVKSLLEPQTKTARDESGIGDWRNMIEGHITDLDSKMTKIDSSLNHMQELLEKKEKQLESRKDYPKKELSEVVPVPRAHREAAQKTVVAAEPGKPAAQGKPQPGGAATAGQQPAQPPYVPNQPSPAMNPLPPSGSFGKIEFSRVSLKQSKKKKSMYIPMGFAQGLTINGSNTPTMNAGEQTPHPIAVSIESEMITANGVRIDVKGCLLLNSAKGSISERAAIVRGVKMECRDKQNNLYSGKVEAFILGDNGKVGMSGRLVSHEGEVLSKVFWADLLKSIGDYLKSQSSIVSTSSYYGTTSTTAPGQVGIGIGGAALGGPSTHISQYIMKIADQIYPLIEVLPGQNVTVFFEGGQTLQMVSEDPSEEENKPEGEKPAQKTKLELRKASLGRNDG